MTTETRMVTAIDVGTTKVCTLVGRKSSRNGFVVLAHSTVPSNGLRKGNVTDIALTESAMRESVRKVQDQIGQPIDSAFVGVTGSHVTYENRTDSLKSIASRGVITADDLAPAPESVAPNGDGSGRQVILSERTSYKVDGEQGIRNPLGMHTTEVEVDSHVVTAGAPFVNRLVQAASGAGLHVENLVLEPYASGLAVLTPEEKDQGAVIVDIGGGTTDLVGFHKGKICYTGVIPVGGYQFTNDIALTFNTPYEAAEEAKLKYASVDLIASSFDAEIMLPVVGQDSELKVRRIEICQLARERAHELARLIKLKLDDGMPEEFLRRIVLTGDASNLPGIGPLMQRTIGTPVRSGVPIGNGSVPAEIKGAAYATALGILLWATTEYVPAPTTMESSRGKRTKNGRRGLLASLLGRARRLGALGLLTTSKGRNGRS